ncbi:MAG: hypothetical protein AAF573_01560 [Bacteroidota bacterium]
MIQKILLSLGVILSLGFSQNLSATDAKKFPFKKPRSIFDKMYGRKVVDVQLVFDLAAVINDRKKDDEHPAQFIYKPKRGQPQYWDVTIKIRGVYRRYNCTEMPPFKLNFSKKDLKARGFSKFDDYKLVTQCIQDEQQARDLVIKEYLAYKYYAAITKESFRVQLLNITYVDSKTDKTIHHVGFIIEDFAELRNRIGAAKVKKMFGVSSASMARVNAEYFQRMAYFQYLIGNTDWGIESLRNIKIAEKDSSWLCIPYDFDFSGLVNAPYATVYSDEESKGISLRDRVFMGLPVGLYPLEEPLALFLKKKRKLKRITRRVRYLSSEGRRDALDYVDSFFDNLGTLRILKSKASF